MPECTHIEGKTYNLFGNSDSTAEYYKTIRDHADRVTVIDGHLSSASLGLRPSFVVICFASLMVIGASRVIDGHSIVTIIITT